MAVVYLALGSNLGNRDAHMADAIEAIKSHKSIELIRMSSWIENPAIEDAGPEDFLNGVIKIETSLSPRDLLKYIHELEKKMGRDPKERKKARTIDIDILFYDEQIIEEDGLKIPHPRILERDFVVDPLREIEPGFDLSPLMEMLAQRQLYS